VTGVLHLTWHFRSSRDASWKRKRNGALSAKGGCSSTRLDSKMCSGRWRGPSRGRGNPKRPLSCDTISSGVPYTNGFADAAALSDHFVKHGSDFGVATEADYLHLADCFLGGPASPTTLEHVRVQGDVIRFDTATNEFGVLDDNRTIRTYFRPVPGVTHRRRTNLEYYQATCRKRF